MAKADYPQIKILLWTLIIIVAHAVGSLWLYNATGWFDKIVHFLGGIWLALVLIASSKKFSPFEIVFAVFVAAVLWEDFEGALNWYAVAAYGFTTPVGGGITDTILDVVFGTLGAFITSFSIQKARDGKIVPE